MPVIQKKIRTMRPARIITLSFLIVILTGTALLMLPIASKSGDFTPFRHAFFTATSSTCGTGLIIYDTFRHWSYFGQTVILMMIQIGGLGLVTLVSFFNFAIGKKLGLRRMQMVTGSVGDGGFDGVKSLVKDIVIFSLVIEAIGAAVLMLSFIPKYGLSGIFTSVFIAVSAFCNAGFDVLGRDTAFSSLTEYAASPAVLVPVMVLIVAGGLGFVVWYDLVRFRKNRHLELHTKIVLIMTAVLIISGALMFLLLEYNNTNTMAGFSFPKKVLNSFFQSITCRTAGFNTLDFSLMNPLTKVFAIMLMFIGAAPGSTGGGIKVTTIVVIIMTVISVFRNRDETTILGRRIEKTVVYKSLAITMVSMMTIFIVSAAIYFSLDSIPEVLGINTVLEVTSAFSTTGVSAGISSIANFLSEELLTAMMFVGRVGPVSVVLSISMNRANLLKKQVVPEGKIMVG